MIPKVADRRLVTYGTSLQADVRAVNIRYGAEGARYDIQFSHAGHKGIRHSRLGAITVPHAAFHVAGHPEQTLVVYHLPAEHRHNVVADGGEVFAGFIHVGAEDGEAHGGALGDEVGDFF